MNPILVHGLFGTPEDWAEIASRFEGTRCLAIPKLRDFDHAAGWLAREIETTPRPRVLMGYSMGGRIALTAAVRSPGLLDALVIESANPGIECTEERARRTSLDDQRAADLRCGGVAPFMEEWYRAPLWESLRANPGSFAAMLQRRAMVDLELAAAHLERLSPGRMPSLWGDLPRLRVPTLFVAGSADEKYRAVLTRATNAVSGSRLSIVGGAGHNTHLERPDGFLHAVRDFLEEPAVDS